MTISTVNIQRTYALVVGIEKYNAGSSWDLNGPANDARNFVDWLCNKGVPPENIFLFLSPLDNNSDLVLPVRIEVQAATHQNVYHTITNILPHQQGDLLYIFWGGHGIITAEEERRLFYADATNESKRNLDLKSLRISFKSDYLRSFPRQIYIVDACANYIVDSRLSNVTRETFPGGTPRKGCEQFLLLATKPGEVAQNVNKRATGLFSEALMKELMKDGGNSWPPNMEELAKNLMNQFEKLRQQGLAKQTPTSFLYRDMNTSNRKSCLV